jgi:predicted GIY-YIG superfamily endonuclease
VFAFPIIGHTDNLEARMSQHHEAEIGYTAERHPLRLVWTCEFPSRLDALERERQIKGWSRAKKAALIRGDWERIHQLARGPSTPRQRCALPLRSG